MLLLVLLVVGALIASDAPASIGRHTSDLICRIAHGGAACGEAKPPPACIIASGTRTASGEVYVNARWVKITVDGGVEATVAQRNDGKYLVTLKIKAGAKVGPGLKADLKAKGIDIDASVRKGGDVAVTYRADSQGQVDTFLGQLKKAAAPDPVGLLCLACRLLRDRPTVDFPPVESFSVNGDTTVNVSGSASVQGPYAQKPKSPDDKGVDDTVATGKAELTMARSLGATYFASGPKQGQTTVFYEVSGSGELTGDLVIGPLVNAALGGKLTGKAKVAITVDKSGRPLSLSIVNTVEGEVNGGIKNSRSTTFGDIAKEIPFYSRDTRGSAGKGLEVTTTIDLTDPRLAAAARKAWTGRDPVTGEPADRSDAALELGAAARDAEQLHRPHLRLRQDLGPPRRRPRGRRRRRRGDELEPADDRFRNLRPGDRSLHVVQRLPHLIAALCAVAVLAGCGGDEREAQPAAGPPRPPAVSVPAGFAPLRGADWAIAVPGGFDRAPVTAAERRELTLLATPELTAGLPAQLAVARSATSPGDFTASVEAMKAQNRLERSDYRLVDEHDADVPGARLARRVEATYVQPDGTPVRTVDLIVHSRRGVRYDVFARAPEADFARLRLAEAVDSFRAG